MSNIEGAVDTAPFKTSVSDNYRGRVTEENIRATVTHSLVKLTTDLQQIGAGKSENGLKEVAKQEKLDDPKSVVAE